MSAFAYIGQAKTGQEFIDYVAGYDFGSVPPSFVVIHNTYSPDASWAPISTNQASWWDRNEAGLSADQIKAKRKPQLDSIMVYYRDTKHWTTGPHLFIDERWIWLFTPMYDVGTHAASGNSYHDASGQLHYSIGIETVGYFQSHGWPEAMQKLLQIAVQTLRDRLKNFDIVYTSAPDNRPDLHDHQISFHNDYNKPECPGAVITPTYAIPILAKPYQTVYMRYVVTSPCAVLTDRQPGAPLANGPDNGQTWLAPGDTINVGDTQGDWLWCSPPNVNKPPGLGFVPSSYARPV
jgi:N-acetylmuramoyl-L-alanine amidase